MSIRSPISDEAPIVDWRFETKYQISLASYFALKSALSPYFKPDYFTKIKPQKRYLVRSLYFDTRDYRFYTEKINGDSDRIKFRIRTYGTHPDQKPDIRVEMKVRKGKLMEKHGAFIDYDQLGKFLTFRAWGRCEDPVLAEFQRYVHRWDLVPKALVQYDREGFETREKENIRLTFDHQIKSFSTRELFPELIFWRKHYHSIVILEIKHQNEIPGWINGLIQKYHLKVIPNSKYANAIEISPKDIILPTTRLR